MTLTNDQKRQLALAFVQYPEHYKPESINDSHLCRFNGGKTRALVCVKSVDSGKRRPCIGFYFISPDKDENLRILRRSELPKGFYLNEDLVTDSQTGWVPFCRRDCETAVEMFRQIVSPGSRHSEWKQMFEFLKTWGRNHLGCQEEYYSSENWNMKDQVACQCNTADCATDEETSPAEEVAEVLVDNVLSAPADPFAGGCKASVVSVEQLLQMNLSIPSYQRPYKWTRRNVEELLQDIRESLKESHQKYRIGTVILDASCGGGRFGIVDGQQRVLTLLLINRLLNHIRRNKVCPQILGDAQTLSFLSSSYVSRKNLHENYAVVRNCLAKDYALRKRIVSAFNTTLEVVVVKVDELSEAFQLFDSQNTRGRALDPHDLFKGISFARDGTEGEGPRC